MSDQKIQFTVISLPFLCSLTVYICSVLRHYFPYWALDCCCSNIKLDGCDIASFNQRWLVSDQKVTDFSNFPQAQNTMGMKYFFSIRGFNYCYLQPRGGEFKLHLAHNFIFSREFLINDGWCPTRKLQIFPISFRHKTQWD